MGEYVKIYSKKFVKELSYFTLNLLQTDIALDFYNAIS